MLTFVGLGLYDERSLTLRARGAITDADHVFGEFYTSRLAGTDLATIEDRLDTEIAVLDRAAVERDPEPVLAAAEDDAVAFVTAGDPMISTTHVDLRLRAQDRGIDTRIVHGTTASAAAASLSGLQNYRFGKATTLPFPDAHGASGDVPESVTGTIADNRERGLHTLVYLDIKVDDPHWEGDGTYLTADRAAALLAPELGDLVGVAIARAGSDDPIVVADRLPALAETDVGPPLHLLVVPGELHQLEREALVGLADTPADVF